MAAALANSGITDWITPQSADDPRPQFDPYDFVRTATGTLYSLSKEGQGTAGPLVTALTVAVVEAAETIASSTTDAAATGDGRLKTPLVGVLDEAANVCRWSDLPDLYSHFGSRGIVLMTLLQSWSQGVDVWGESGMKKLWSAANVKLYGGNVAEDEFLNSLSNMIGTWDKETRSIS
ncbi:TraG/TraD/VirD4 family protein, partial [Agrococcus terreus]